MRFNIDRLVREHLEEAYQLSAQVGWNQTVGDWRRLIELNPASCFGGFLDGRLAATATLSCYDKVAWVGMVIVDQLHRCRERWGITYFAVRALEEFAPVIAAANG